MDFFVFFYQIKQVHGIVAGITFSLVILLDLYGATWVLGFQKFLNKNILTWSHRIVFVGLSFLILTGVIMAYLNFDEYILKTVFWVKMFFVSVLLWNAFRIGNELHILSLKSFKELSENDKKHMLIVGGTSFVSWVSVLVLVNIF